MDDRRQAPSRSVCGALRAAITPGDRVVEVGAGFGFFTVVAARAGAGHVDAVDTNPVIHLGPRVAALNGCEDRITFHHSAVADVSLPIPADIILIDVRGPTPFGSRSLEILIDARDRLLRPGGRIIAREDRVMVAPVRTPQTFRREVMRRTGEKLCSSNRSSASSTTRPWHVPSRPTMSWHPSNAGWSSTTGHHRHGCLRSGALAARSDDHD